MRHILVLIGQSAMEEGFEVQCVTFRTASPDTPPGAWLSKYRSLSNPLKGAGAHWTTRALQHAMAVYAPCRTHTTHGMVSSIDIPLQPGSATLRAIEGRPRRHVARFLDEHGASETLVAEAMGDRR